VDQVHTYRYSSSLPTRNSRNLQNNTKKKEANGSSHDGSVL
jgi:hypothetical protein